MCDWKKWIFPGLFVVGVLTVLAAMFRPDPIEAELKSRVDAALSGQYDWASVSLDARDLTLSGTAPSEGARDEALAIASAAYDVRVAKTDADLIAIASPYPFSAVKDDNGLTLSGNIPDEVTRVELIARAQQAMPGIAVKDEMTLARGAAAGFVPLADFGLSQLADLISGKVEISDSAYSIVGVAADNPAYQNAIATRSSALPGNGTVALVDITPPAITGDYTFGAQLNDQDLVLQGFAPDDATRTMLVERATALFPDATIDNQIMLATGAPAEFSNMAAFGLDQLTSLSSGSIGLTNQDFIIEGVAKTSSELIKTRGALSGALPNDMNLASIAILPPLNTGDYVLSAAKSDATLRLGGVAPTLDDIKAIEAVARDEFPDIEIVNELQVASGAPDGVNWQEASIFGLRQLGDLKSGAMQLVNTDFSVTGEAATSSTFEMIEDKLSGTLPAGITTANSAVTAPMVDPYRWSAIKSSDEIVLAGFAPSRDIANLNVENASKLATIKDRQLLGSGATEIYGEAVNFGLSSLEQLDRGSALLSGNTLKINGETADLATKLRLDQELVAVAPQGVDITVNISALPITNYKWTAIKTSDQVVLGGFGPTNDALLTNVANAKKVTSGAIIDEQKLGAGAPDGLADATQLALKILARLENGDANYENGALAIQGHAPSFVERIALEDELGSTSLAGTSLTFALTSPEPIIPELPALPAPPAPIEPIIIAPTPLPELPPLPTPPAPIEPIIVKVAPEPTALPELPALPTPPAPIEPMEIVKPAPVGSELCDTASKSLAGALTIGFETNKAIIKSESYSLLEDVLNAVNACSTQRYLVEGHTDSEGAEAYNQQLSEDRAQAVVDWLTKRGVPVANIEAKGVGETMPIADNNTSEGRALNRRIQIKAIQ